ncbi:11937_t:CDS:2 [Dentiscutata erythropus]|uniref:11937_t:CDS:1 n=1 Tax=Dentiscutata erythropus TaxID=1348616 RepID=A0A9N9E3G4_9GLOM|nr:11937_t:CDS:2 [Dentiscutata erythropus]
MTKPKTNRINKDQLKNATIKPRTRDLVKCNCTWHCEGGHWVDPRTRAKHQKELEAKSVRSLLEKQKYKSDSVEPNLSGNDFSNSFFKDDIVADLNKTELEE